MRYTCVIALALVVCGVTASPAQAFWKHHGWHRGQAYYYPGQFALAPQSVVPSQGLMQWLPLLQIGMHFLDSGNLGNLGNLGRLTTPPALPTISQEDMKRIDDSLTKLDGILTRTKAINPKTTP
jgi:hypothetical protein